jgi:hypothetical protein
MSDATDKSVFIDAFYKYLAMSVLKADPGEYAVYCNDGFIMCQIMVEEVSGMGYTEFVQKYLMAPIGAVSTCSGENNPTGRPRVKMRGGDYEKIMCVGTGGISTAIYDCARFGWEFIEPGKIFPASYVEETAKKASERRILPGCEAHCGLGWDGVDFYGYGTDLGPCLQKGGNTFQFKAQLVVSRKYRIAGAISATNDCPFEPIQLISEIMADAAGLEFKVPAAPEKKPMPAGYAEKYAGRYYSATGFYEISFKDDKITVTNNGDEKPMIADLPFNGKDFGAITFETDERGISYAILNRGFTPMAAAEKPASFGALDPTWLARDGKRYFITSAKHSDLILGNSVATGKIEVEKDTGIVWFVMNTRDGGCNRMPAMSDGPDKLRTFLTAPNGGSRDHFAPVVTEKDGVEYIRVMNIDAADESVVKELTEGCHKVSENGMQWFSVPAGKKYKVEAGKARLTVVDGEGFVLKDSMCDGEVTEVEGPGWLWAMTGEETCVKAKEIRA